MMTTGGDDTRLEERIEELVERGLDRYGKGDLEGALSDWKHVLALDPDHERAADYVAYVEKHYEIRAGAHEPACDPAAELVAPFGIEVPAGLAADDLDAYESIEVDGGRGTTESAAVGDGYIDLPLAEPIELERHYGGLEDGWNVDEDWSASARARRADTANLGEETTSERAATSPPSPTEDDSIDIELGPLDLAEPPRRTVLGLGDPRELMAATSQARGAVPEIELELDLGAVELSPSKPEPPEADAGRARPPPVPVDIPIDLDEELTVERGTRAWDGRAKVSRAPTEDPAIDIESVPVDETLLSFEDTTSQLDVRDLAARHEVGAARPAKPPPLPEVADSDDSARLADELLAAADRGAPAGESEPERLRRRVTALFDRAEAEARAGELRTAVVAAELAVAQQPESAVVHRALADRSDTLVRLYASFLGDLTRVPAMTASMSELSSADLDHRTAFLLSRVDGTLSLDDLLDVSGMPRIEALRVLSRLVLRGILQIAP